MSIGTPSPPETGVRLARRGAFALGARLGTVGLAFCLQLTLARLLSVRGYGEFALAITWMNVLVGFSMLGMDRASLRFPAEYLARGDQPLLNGFLLRSTQLGLLGSGTVAVGWLLVTIGFRSHMTDGLFRCCLVASILIPIMAVAQIRDATLLSVGRVYQGLIGNGLRTGLFLLLLSLLALMGASPGSWEAVGLQFAASVVSLVLSTWFLSRWRSVASLTEASEFETRGWLTVSLPLMAVVLMALGMNQSGILLTGLLLGTEASGLYAVAVRLCDVSLLGYHAVNTVVAPRFAALQATEQTESLQRLLTHCVLTTTAVTLGIGTLLVLCGPFILSLFGQEFVASYPVLLVLLAGVAVVAALGPVVYLLNMTGQQQLCLAAYTGFVALNLCLSLALIPRWGMNGAAVATASSLAGCHLTLVAIVRRRYGLIPHVPLRLSGRTRRSAVRPDAPLTTILTRDAA